MRKPNLLRKETKSSKKLKNKEMDNNPSQTPPLSSRVLSKNKQVNTSNASKASKTPKAPKPSRPPKKRLSLNQIVKEVNPKSKSRSEILHTKAILEVMSREDREFSVQEVSEKSKLSMASVYIWICSVGKRTKEIKKVGVGLYKYEGSD